MQDLREALAPLGIDITTRDAEAWAIRYPEQAQNITRICLLEQQLADLQLQLAKEAAE